MKSKISLNQVAANIEHSNMLVTRV